MLIANRKHESAKSVSGMLILSLLLKVQEKSYSKQTF